MANNELVVARGQSRGQEAEGRPFGTIREQVEQALKPLAEHWGVSVTEDLSQRVHATTEELFAEMPVVDGVILSFVPDESPHVNLTATVTVELGSETSDPGPQSVARVSEVAHRHSCVLEERPSIFSNVVSTDAVGDLKHAQVTDVLAPGAKFLGAMYRIKASAGSLPSPR